MKALGDNVCLLWMQKFSEGGGMSGRKDDEILGRELRIHQSQHSSPEGNMTPKMTSTRHN